jgi:anti-sigma factor RsiW
VLDQLLEKRLPRRAAPDALRRRLLLLAPSEARVELTAAPPPRAWRRLLAPALAAGLLLASAGLYFQAKSVRSEGALTGVATEAINDHLRVLASQRPFEIESTGTHEVKPWFEGRLDFAPVVPEAEGTELQLRGGAVGYFQERKAAVVLYRLRRHQVTLLAFPAQGLELPSGTLSLGSVHGWRSSARGFQVVGWQVGDVGYALVSDVGSQELTAYAARLAPQTAVH